MQLHQVRSGILAAMAVALLSASPLSASAEDAQAGSAGIQAAPSPDIAITRIPPPGAGANTRGTIAGKASGVSARATRVVYAYGDRWYVQPTYAQPYTQISGAGAWKTPTHLGYRYAALLVRKEFVPPATFSTLPEVGGDVLAVTVADPSRRFSGSLHYDVPVSPRRDLAKISTACARASSVREVEIAQLERPL